VAELHYSTFETTGLFTVISDSTPIPPTSDSNQFRRVFQTLHALRIGGQHSILPRQPRSWFRHSHVLSSADLGGWRVCCPDAGGDSGFSFVVDRFAAVVVSRH